MAIGIARQLAPLDKAEVLADLYESLGLLGLTTTAFEDGEPAPTLLDGVVGLLVDRLWNPIIVPALGAPFLDYSFGNWLSEWIRTAYRRPRLEAQQATSTLVVENHNLFGTGTLAPGQVRVKNTVTGKTYSNTTAISLVGYSGSGDFPSGSYTFAADEVGSAGNAQPGDLQSVSTPLVVGPVGVFAQTNAGPFLGSDEETDDRAKTRARAAVGDLSSAGPRAGYLSAALDPIGAFTRRRKAAPPTWGTTPPAITRMGLFEDLGGVTVWVASDSGPAAGTAGDTDSDVGKASVAIQMWIRPPGVPVTVRAAVGVDVALGTITLAIDTASGVTTAEAIATAAAALTTFFATLPIGGTKKVPGLGWVFADKVRAVVEQGPGVVGSTMTFSDTELDHGEVAVPSWTLQANEVDQG